MIHDVDAVAHGVNNGHFHLDNLLELILFLHVKAGLDCLFIVVDLELLLLFVSQHHLVGRVLV